MEVLLIGKAKMKIVLTNSEVEDYGIEASEECRDSLKMRRKLYKILEEAGKISGFDHTGDKLLLQFYPLSDGGCEIFVTKLGILPKASSTLVESSDRIMLLSKRRVCYGVESRESLSALFFAIKSHPSGVIPKGDAFLCPRGGYLLCVEECQGRGSVPEFPFICEYASPLPTEAEDYATEHFFHLGEISHIIDDLVAHSE